LNVNRAELIHGEQFQAPCALLWQTIRFKSRSVCRYYRLRPEDIKDFILLVRTAGSSFVD